MIQSQTHGQLEYLTAQHLHTPHCFTTRLGGVSRGCLESLNIGTSRGDDPENVLENYRRLGSAIGFDIHSLVLSRQTHSSIVCPVTEKDRGVGLFAPPLPECDALITNTPGLALVVFTADCTPILLWDSATGAVGAAHAGWRGTASGIAARVVEAAPPSAPTSAPATLRRMPMCPRPWSPPWGRRRRNGLSPGGKNTSWI